MNALILAALLASELSPPPPPPAEPAREQVSPAPPPAVRLLPEVTAKVAAAAQPVKATISFSPLSFLFLSAVLEGEFRVSDSFTTYLVGEFYGPWLGWAGQAGMRWYPTEAFRGFFVDAHARAHNLYVSHLAGGGLEVGSQHQLDRSRWMFRWSVGADVGLGSWDSNVSGNAYRDVVAVPKLRLMLAYAF